MPQRGEGVFQRTPVLFCATQKSERVDTPPPGFALLPRPKRAEGEEKTNMSGRITEIPSASPHLIQGNRALIRWSKGDAVHNVGEHSGGEGQRGNTIHVQH